MKQKISTSITYIIPFLGMAPNLYPQFWPCIHSLWYHHIRISLEHQEKPFQNQVYNFTFNTFFISSLYLLFLPDSSQKSLLILLSFYPHPINQSLSHTNPIRFHDTRLLCIFSENLWLRGPSPECLGYYSLTLLRSFLALCSPTSDSGPIILSAWNIFSSQFPCWDFI